MTSARSEIVNASEVGVYHCISRCVRRAFLCGLDKVTGRSFEHRREWIRQGISDLSHIFAIEIFAFAILSNHLHALLRIRPDIAAQWNSQEVAIRWRRLFPLRRGLDGRPAEPSAVEIQAIMSDPARVELYRRRLSSLSWFHRCLKEKIAKRANAEDECTGRFWEGRFKCQRVYDLSATLACATYIDLNPIRAGTALALEESDHTSIQDRIHQLQNYIPDRCKTWKTIPLVSIPEITDGAFTTEEYLALVDETARHLCDGKRSISPNVEQILIRLKIKPAQWHEVASRLNQRFRRIVGPAHSMIVAANDAQKQWFQGIKAARAIFQSA